MENEKNCFDLEGILLLHFTFCIFNYSVRKDFTGFAIAAFID